METFEQMALRVAKDVGLVGEFGTLTERDIKAFASRIRDELCKGQEPVAEVRAANDTIRYPHLARLVDVGLLPTGSKLYLHPAPIPADMVMVPREPTEAMRMAGMEESPLCIKRMYERDGDSPRFTGTTHGFSDEAVAEIYKAMIAAYEKEQG